MYSFTDSHEDGSKDQLVEDQSADLMCMFDVIPYNDELPKYDQCDDDYVVKIEANSTRQSITCFCEEEASLQQLRCSTQPMYINHDNNEENP